MAKVEMVATGYIRRYSGRIHPGEQFTTNSRDARTYRVTGRATRLQRDLERQTDRIVSARIIAHAIIDKRKQMAGTAKVQGAPSRLDQILAKAEEALEGAFSRLEKAADGTLQNAATINGVAETVEKSNAMMADKLSQTTNGGPPLLDSTTGA